MDRLAPSTAPPDARAVLDRACQKVAAQVRALVEEYRLEPSAVDLIGGGGGAFTPGRHIKHGSKPMSNLFLSMVDAMGIDGIERFGDSTGRLSNV